MKIKVLLTAVTAAAALMAVAAPQRLDIASGAFHPVLSPDGSTLLFSSVDHTGLQAFDVATGRITMIDRSAAAGFRPVFTADGSQILYRTASTVDGLVYRDIRSYDITSAAATRMAAPSRDNTRLEHIAGAATYAVANFKVIDVTVDGVTSQISPLADAHTYQWSSLSPDASQLAFCEPFQGVFVSGADGSDARCILTKGDYVAWAGPHTVIAVVSHDDGYVILDSRLVAVDTVSGEVEYLTEPDVMVSEATAAPTGLVVFSDLDGNMFTLDINTK